MEKKYHAKYMVNTPKRINIHTVKFRGRNFTCWVPPFIAKPSRGPITLLNYPEVHRTVARPNSDYF